MIPFSTFHYGYRLLTVVDILDDGWLCFDNLTERQHRVPTQKVKQ